MEKNIISVDPQYIKASVEEGVCPLNWLAKYYKEYPGKLVMIDNKLFEFLLNKSHVDKVAFQEHDGYKQQFNLTWNATEKYPETKITISSYGKDEIIITDQHLEGKPIKINSKTNYYVIEKLAAEDILSDDKKYAENQKSDGQIIFLVQKSPEKILELELSL